MLNVIRKKKVLAVEGDDEINFFDSLLKYLGISDIEIRKVGGKDQFKNKLPALVESSGFFDNVEVFAVIRDANADANAAFASVKNILKKLNLNPPTQMNKFANNGIKLGVFIMPGNSAEGMLEDLCLNTVQQHPKMTCVNEFIECIFKLEDPPKNLAKAKAQSFLSAIPIIANSIGIGAKKGY
ncbi:hypothetical protein ISS22_00135 [candidate division KSB1 bacterium]|nr:hypothetical protein [candidate division KSB1 bacterium]